MKMLCVRSWVFAGKVSPKFVQLAYKVPVSVPRDPAVLYISFIYSRNKGVLHVDQAECRGQMGGPGCVVSAKIVSAGLNLCK